jgi:hypothetical protein
MLKRLLFVSLALATVVALVFAIDAYRAKRAWIAVKQELTAAGEALNRDALAPAPVPNDQNFLATPILAPCFGFAEGAPEQPNEADPPDTDSCKDLSRRLSWAGHLGGANWRKGTVIDLSRWQQELRATGGGEGARLMAQRYGMPENAFVGASVVEQQASVCPAWRALRARPPGSPLEDARFLLDYDRAALDEIRLAAQRPHAQLLSFTELGPDELTDQIARLKSLVHPFRASCLVELIEGNPANALVDFETTLRLADAAGSQPMLIAPLVKISILAYAMSPLWQGLAEHRWSEASLAELEARLSRINIVGDFLRAWHGQAALVLASLDKASNPSDGQEAATGSSSQDRKSSGARERRYQDQVDYLRQFRTMESHMDPSGPNVRIEAPVQGGASTVPQAPDSGSEDPAAGRWPIFNQSIDAAAAGQTIVTLARVAIALERHRLSDRVYPEALEALVPRFLDRLPVDPVNGGPLRYRREAPDRFVLYSVGLDGRDDGGTSTSTGFTSRTGKGDSVWRSDPVEKPAKAVDLAR